MNWSDNPFSDPTEINLPAWLRKDEPANAAMLKRDEPSATPAMAVGEDPLAGVRAAIVTALHATRIGGAKDSELAHREAYILEEVRRLLMQPEAEPAPVLADASIPQGLMAEHRPGDRWSISL